MIFYIFSLFTFIVIKKKRNSPKVFHLKLKKEKRIKLRWKMNFFSFFSICTQLIFHFLCGCLLGKKKIRNNRNEDEDEVEVEEEKYFTFVFYIVLFYNSPHFFLVLKSFK